LPELASFCGRCDTKEELFSYREAARRVSETLKNDTKNQEPGPKARDASLRPKEPLRQPRILLGAVAVVISIGALVAWLAVYNNSHRSSTPSAEPVAPVGLSEGGLRTLAVVVHQPIYWVGPKRKGYLYELTRTKDAKVYIRYLPPDANVGTKKPYLTIATDPNPNAFQDLKASHGQEQDLPGGGIALVDEKSPTTVHLAYPGVAYEVDVYDPSPTRAQLVADSGQVRPVVR
jgi:hypothetical protein